VPGHLGLDVGLLGEVASPQRRRLRDQPLPGARPTVARGLVVLPMVNTTRTSGTNLARLLTATELACVTGAYFVGRQPAGSSLASYDAVANEALYRRSLHLIGDAARPETAV
jgi:hypothetical protein